MMASQVQHEEAQVMSKKLRKSQRGQSFSDDEDKLLIQAWLNVSADGDKQRHTAYWKRVLEYFDSHKKFESSRNQNSLMNRWSTMQISVTRFCGCLDSIEDSSQSGVPEDDKVRTARLMYKELYKHFFPFEHCWDILKYKAKWLEKYGNKGQNCKKSVPAPSTTDSANLTDDNASHTSFVDLESPSKSEPEKCISNEQRAMEHESANLELISIDTQEDKRKMNAKKLETSEESFDPEKKRIRIEEERLRLEREREDERIIMMDISGLTPLQAKYYQRRQREILERYENL